MKNVIRFLLLGFVAITSLYAAGILPGEKKAEPQPVASSDVKELSPAAASKVIAYYFHTTNRCSNCMKFEAWGGEALQARFSEALKTGALEWRVINIEEPQNRHFVDDYRLHTKSIVLSKIQAGKQTEWKNLDKIWELLTDKEEFTRYVAAEAEQYLTGGGRS